MMNNAMRKCLTIIVLPLSLIVLIVAEVIEAIFRGAIIIERTIRHTHHNEKIPPTHTKMGQ